MTVYYRPAAVQPDDLVPGDKYWAEFSQAQLLLGKFRYTSGEGFLYFDNGSLMSGDSVTFYPDLSKDPAE